LSPPRPFGSERPLPAATPEAPAPTTASRERAAELRLLEVGAGRGLLRFGKGGGGIADAARVFRGEEDGGGETSSFGGAEAR